MQNTNDVDNITDENSHELTSELCTSLCLHRFDLITSLFISEWMWPRDLSALLR